MSVESAPSPSDSNISVSSIKTARPGEVFGRFQLLLPIASGGMGSVWVARHLGHPDVRRLVALKVAHESLAADENYRRMFLDEARLASAIQHPNVCTVLDVGEQEGRLYLVMEWLGGSLRELLSKSPKRALAPEIAARVIADACAGLHAAHELHDDDGRPLDVIHRDISPDNILLSLDGRVKVTDFGVARARDQLHQRTRTGEIKGKLSFMAPEQITGRSYDRRVDVFSLGCVLYSAAVGKKAFKGGTDSEAAVIYAILESRFSRPHEIHPEFPTGLEAIILRAMARQPDERFPTADAMRVALEDWLAETKSKVTSADVGAVIRETLGLVLAERSERIRNAISNIESASSASRESASSASSASRESVSSEISVVVESGTGTRLVKDLPSGAGAPPESTKNSARPPRLPLRWVGPGVATLGVLAVIGALAAFASKRPEPAHGSATASATPMSANPVESAATNPIGSAPSSVSSTIGPERITLSLSATPAHATISVDDAPAVRLPFRREFPRDDSSHRIRVDARGFQSDVRTVVFDQSRELVIELRPVSAPVALPKIPASAHPAATPTQTGTTDAIPTAAPTPTVSGPKKRRSIDRDLTGD